VLSVTDTTDYKPAVDRLSCQLTNLSTYGLGKMARLVQYEWWLLWAHIAMVFIGISLALMVKSIFAFILPLASLIVFHRIQTRLTRAFHLVHNGTNDILTIWEQLNPLTQQSHVHDWQWQAFVKRLPANVWQSLVKIDPTLLEYVERGQ
jgi:hypothetical protein